MPLRKTSNPLPAVSTVTVLFAGQLLIDSSGASPCDIKVNYKADKHELLIGLIVNEPGRPPSLLPLHKGKLKRKDFSITVTAATSPGGVVAYEPGTFDPSDPHADPRDLRWSLDFNRLHAPGTIKVNPELAEPGISLSDGVLHTYKRTIPGLNIELMCSGTTTIIPRMAASIAAAILLAPGDQVKLDWYASGENPPPITLPRTHDDDGTTYVVAIINYPPLGYKMHEELQHYYKVLRKNDGSNIPDPEKCQLIVGGLTEKTDEIPCVPIIGPSPPHGDERSKAGTN